MPEQRKITQYGVEVLGRVLLIRLNVRFTTNCRHAERSPWSASSLPSLLEQFLARSRQTEPSLFEKCQ